MEKFPVKQYIIVLFKINKILKNPKEMPQITVLHFQFVIHVIFVIMYDYEY